MRQRRFLAFTTILAAGVAALVLAVRDAPPREEKRGPAAPSDYFLLQRSAGGKKPDARDVERATRQAAALAAADAAAAPRQLRRPWEHVGPTNIGGRVADLVLDPSNGDIVYIGTASGGVWKSTDGGATFSSVWPSDLTQMIGALAMTPEGDLWVGTGEGNGSGFSYGGNGIFVSSDGGHTWKQRGPKGVQNTGRIVIDPLNSRRIFAAVEGYLWNDEGPRGIYRSVNGGSSFELVLAPEDPFGGGADIAIDPTNPNRIFATMWGRRGEFARRIYAGEASGLYRSLDGGDTWQRLENIVTPAPNDHVRLARSPDLGRMAIAIAPSNPNRMYLFAIARVGANPLGFYVSDDGGETFHARTDPGSQGGFGWWFGRIWVDPRDAEHVFVAGVNLRRSTNGGTTWGNSGGVHADQHAMAWDRSRPGVVYLGNDGGVYRSEANGVGGSWVKAAFETYTQFYTVDVGETDPTHVTGGTQDNGCLRSWRPTENVWNAFGCGDGLATLVDPVDPTIYYGCSQNGAGCIRRRDNDPSFSRTISNGTVSQRRNWLTPVVFDPNDSQVIYYAGNVLNRSTNRGNTWTALSPGHPDDLAGTTDLEGDDPNFGTISTVAPAATDANTIYVGTDTGRVWKTTDLGATWIEFTDKGLPTRWVTRIAVDPRDANVAWVVYSGFRWDDDAAHIFATADGGETWTNISGNLPNAPINDVVVDVERSTLYVGNDTGVYYLKNGWKNWKPVGVGLPIAPVHDLRLHAPSATLFAATHGRGIWKVAVPASE